jgi:hypothetical protein
MGIPYHLVDEHEGVVLQTIGDASADALRQAGIAVQTGAPQLLVATVTHYWMDGYMGYSAVVAVRYELRNASGHAVWSGEARGQAGGTSKWSIETLGEALFQRALTQLASSVGTQFKSAAFRAVVGS